jgi:hypothetical protein
MFTSVIQRLNFGACAGGDVAFLSGGPRVDWNPAWFFDRLDGGWIYRESVRALHLALVFEVCFSDVEEGCIQPHILANH